MNDWRVVPVTADHAGAFVAYCRAHGAEHDESLLAQDDFVPTAEYPAYLLVGERGAGGEAAEVYGAACLICEPGYVRQRIARLMILHAVQPSRAAYAALLHALAPHLAGLEYAYGFIPEQLTEVRQIWEALGFRVERYAYVLEHTGTDAPRVEMPAGYRFQSVHESDQAALATFCELLNVSFAGQPQRADADPAQLARDMQGPYGLPNGLLLLRDEERPVATVRVERDNEESAASISGVTVHPAYRGRGLGHLLIRQALDVAHGHGLRPVYLSVAAGNEAAIRLYVSEGFQKKWAMVCYRWRPGDAA
jgi:ribosomal protein S18 acetylase RimI-like enzyme